VKGNGKDRAGSYDVKMQICANERKRRRRSSACWDCLLSTRSTLTAYRIKLEVFLNDGISGSTMVKPG